MKNWTENYKGYSMKVLNKLKDSPNTKQLMGEVKGPTGKIMRVYGSTKDEVSKKLKALVDQTR